MFGVSLSDVVSGWSVLHQASWTFAVLTAAQSFLGSCQVSLLDLSVCALVLLCSLTSGYHLSPRVLPLLSLSVVPPAFVFEATCMSTEFRVGDLEIAIRSSALATGP